MNNFDKIAYTMKHRYALSLVTKKYLKKEMINNFKYHDMDKVLMMLYIDKELASKFHRIYSDHHDEGKQIPNEDNLYEMIMDWECARYTKPDKPFNANDTLYKYHKKLIDDIKPLLKKLKLDYDSLPFDYNDEIYLKTKEYEVTEEFVNEQLLDFIKNGNLYNDILKECANIYLENKN